MTLAEHTVIGTYERVCFREIVSDLEIEDVFEDLIGEPIDEFDYDPFSHMGEDRLIHKLIDRADGEYILASDTIGADEHMHYAVIKLSE